MSVSVILKQKLLNHMAKNAAYPLHQMHVAFSQQQRAFSNYHVAVGRNATCYLEKCNVHFGEMQRAVLFTLDF